MTTTFTLKGLHCPACKKLTEKRIGTIIGVQSVDVETDTGIVQIVAGALIAKSEVTAALRGTEYSVA